MTAVDWRLSAQEWAPKVQRALLGLEEDRNSRWDRDILEDVAKAIRSRRMSIFDLEKEMHIRKNTFAGRLRSLGIDLDELPRGPLSVYDPDDLRRSVDAFRQTTHLTPGYKRLAISIAPEGVPPPFNAVYRAVYPRPAHKRPGKPLHPNRFDAKYTDYLWHTDLHEVRTPPDPQGDRSLLYVIAFMDDATRFIVGWELIPDKTAATCARVLARILDTNTKPCVSESAK
jgi:hypothetical protein